MEQTTQNTQNVRPKQRVVRINESTGNMLDGLGQKSIDAGVQLLWKKTCEQAVELKEWRSVTKAKTPLAYTKACLKESEHRTP